MAVNIWVALHGIISLRTSQPPDHPWPPVETLIDAALVGPSQTRPRNITTRSGAVRPIASTSRQASKTADIACRAAGSANYRP
jgi:hypothetical protein